MTIEKTESPWRKCTMANLILCLKNSLQLNHLIYDINIFFMIKFVFLEQLFEYINRRRGDLQTQETENEVLIYSAHFL